MVEHRTDLEVPDDLCHMPLQPATPQTGRHQLGAVVIHWTAAVQNGAVMQIDLGMLITTSFATFITTTWDVHFLQCCVISIINKSIGARCSTPRPIASVIWTINKNIYMGWNPHFSDTRPKKGGKTQKSEYLQNGASYKKCFNIIFVERNPKVLISGRYDQ